MDVRKIQARKVRNSSYKNVSRVLCVSRYHDIAHSQASGVERSYDSRKGVVLELGYWV